MYVVTFYSYKGGVGRTMALVNTSVALARAGRRVLAVDFDLEAPGLPSYTIFEHANCDVGLVDYVTAFRTTGIAPRASEYIVDCEVDGNKIWLMPAGRHTKPGYTEALNAIDWQDLYEHQQGYLMFEDLKQQWARYDGKGFDYVLIDSRTGHTDVGGICTRQLPDAVVIMFLPNEQNIAGLAPIVGGIRAENRHRKRPIALEFCPSNVPDLDDEKEILSSLLVQAKEKLGYKREPAAVLHHYGSLDILAQQAFVLSRPNSRLAKEYEKLRSSIVALNFDDLEGARITLARLPADYERARSLSRARVRDEVRANAIDIRSRHPKDGEIAYLAALVFSQISDPAEEIDALSAAITLGYELNRARLARAFGYFSINRRDDALADLYEIVSSPTATIFELGPALQLLRGLDPEWVRALAWALDRPDTAFSTIMALMTFVLSEREALPVMADRMVRSFDSESLSTDERNQARNTAALAMIGSGQFTRAKASLQPAADQGVESLKLIDLFNFSIADWGEHGVPSEALFKLAAQRCRENPETGANFHQCFALASAVIGDVEVARHEIEAAQAEMRTGGLEFSCWRYLYVDADDMAADLADMLDKLDAEKSLEPTFFAEVKS